MLRIISGVHKGRKIATGHLQAERPSLDRVRETLFNWLSLEVTGARCLDTFAGSGALGLEALSRGASHCCFIDTKAENLAALRLLAQRWNVSEASYQLINSACPQALSKLPDSFDLVFLDPPFSQPQLLEQCLSALLASAQLNPQALIYYELARAHGEIIESLPPALSVHKQAHTSTIVYGLLKLK